MTHKIPNACYFQDIGVCLDTPSTPHIHALDAGTGFKFPSAHPKAELVHKHPVFFFNGFETFCKYRDRVALNFDSLVRVQVTKVPVDIVQNLHNRYLWF